MIPDAVELTVLAGVAAPASSGTPTRAAGARSCGSTNARCCYTKAAVPFPSCCWDTDRWVVVVILEDDDAASAVALSLVGADLLQGKLVMAGWYH
jgi:hypothetical protein